ncbi:hypothetical protein AHOG_01570 [Actinoalloteichus hoggarensis]|uniref:DUF6779 domain-containing protein n=2 Tax=Actinoalloteichus hoggarensis TaxID=1470176 RepID=A0A221VWQ0_9PSEU|nr:hypothetical protein AHOG_01570 [Actinoalloteichus hoggarensis]
MIWALGAGLALIATVVLILGDDERLLRLGLLAALWTALLGAFAAARYRKDAAARTGEADRLQQIYELELEREISARREYELEVEAETRRQVEDEVRDESRQELDALRTELRTLRENLEALLGGDVLVERVALRAESTRLRSLSDQSRVIAAHDDEVRSITAAGSSSVVSAEETQIIDALVSMENSVAEMRSGEGRGAGAASRGRTGRTDRAHPVEQWRAGAGGPRREDSGRQGTRRPPQRAQVPPQQRPGPSRPPEVPEETSSRPNRMTIDAETVAPPMPERREPQVAAGRKPAAPPPVPGRRPPAPGRDAPPPSPPQRGPQPPPSQEPPGRPPRSGGPAKRPAREEPTRQIDRPPRRTPAPSPPMPPPEVVDEAALHTAVAGWQPEPEVEAEQAPTGRRAARGRRAAPDDDADAGAHASGRSVSELLAAYGDEQPRRHRRRAE